MNRVLVIDDEKNILLTLNMFLNKKGYIVKSISNGAEALDLAEKYMPDIILLDILLPGLNGYLLCRTLKGNYSTKHIPVIFMSAKNQNEDIKQAFEAGGDDYIIKPFTYQQIEKVINKYLKENKKNE